MIWLLIYLFYGAAFVYHMNMKNLFEDEITLDFETAFAVAVVTLTWPLWVFILINEASDLQKANSDLKKRTVSKEWE